MTDFKRDLLPKYRWRLDVLDVEIGALLERRLALSLETQAAKIKAGLPRVDETREEETVSASLHAGRGATVAGMMREILRACREAGEQLEKNLVDEMEASI